MTRIKENKASANAFSSLTPSGEYNDFTRNQYNVVNTCANFNVTPIPDSDADATWARVTGDALAVIADMIIEKFAYLQPLYRQHIKLQDSGIYVSRAWITKLMPAAVSLGEPIFNAQLESVRRLRVIAMDETP